MDLRVEDTLLLGVLGTSLSRRLQVFAPIEGELYGSWGIIFHFIPGPHVILLKSGLQADYWVGVMLGRIGCGQDGLC